MPSLRFADDDERTGRELRERAHLRVLLVMALEAYEVETGQRPDRRLREYVYQGA